MPMPCRYLGFINYGRFRTTVPIVYFGEVAAHKVVHKRP